jgi:two-component system phosphate regulon sensor histidine kinase PhoR
MKIVEDLDLITKLESGVMDLRVVRTDLHALVDEAIRELEMQARERGVTLRNEVLEDTVVMADKGRLVQVCTNLLNNAINYGRPSGTCIVRSYPLGDQVIEAHAQTISVKSREEEGTTFSFTLQKGD